MTHFDDRVFEMILCGKPAGGMAVVAWHRDRQVIELDCGPDIVRAGGPLNRGPLSQRRTLFLPAHLLDDFTGAPGVPRPRVGWERWDGAVLCVLPIGLTITADPGYADLIRNRKISTMWALAADGNILGRLAWTERAQRQLLGKVAGWALDTRPRSKMFGEERAVVEMMAHGSMPGTLRDVVPRRGADRWTTDVRNFVRIAAQTDFTGGETLRQGAALIRQGMRTPPSQIDEVECQIALRIRDEFVSLARTTTNAASGCADR